MASGTVEKPNRVISFGISLHSSWSIPAVNGLIIFVSRASVGVTGFIAVDMLSEITYYGTNNFLTNITATASNDQITVTNNSGVAVQVTVIYPS